MLANHELERLNAYKARVEAGDQSATRADKQWVLDICAREGFPLPAIAVASAAVQGFFVDNIRVEEFA